MRLLIWAWGILFHSSSKASRSSLTLPGGFWRCRTRVSRLSQRCSMGFRSGLFEGQSSMKSVLLFRKNWILSRATWGLAFSCWNTEITPWFCKRGTTCGARTWSLYFWAFKLPSMTTNWVRYPLLIPAQTTTEPHHQNDPAEERNNQRNVHSYVGRPWSDHHYWTMQTWIHLKKESSASLALSSWCYQLIEACHGDDDPLILFRHRDDVHANCSQPNDFVRFEQRSWDYEYLGWQTL